MGDISLQWYPGHMASSIRKIEEDLKKVDAVAELIDARAPRSSTNPALSAICEKKPHIILLGKSDLADPLATRRWVEYFRKDGTTAVPVNCRSGKGIPDFLSATRRVSAEKLRDWKERGMENRPLRFMVVGIPNVGKSSLINRLKTAGKTKVEDRPGVTRQNQWFSVGDKLELLDTPGVLWPKFEDQTVGEHLAFIGSIRDEILDLESLAVRLLETLAVICPEKLDARYKTDFSIHPPASGIEMLEAIGKQRGMLKRGSQIDTERAARTVIDEYRAGNLGAITLEAPED